MRNERRCSDRCSDHCSEAETAKHQSFSRFIPLLNHNEAFRTKWNHNHATHFDATHKYCTTPSLESSGRLKDDCNAATENRLDCWRKNTNKFPTVVIRRFAIHNVPYVHAPLGRLFIASVCRALMMRSFWPRGVQSHSHSSVLPAVSRCLFVSESFSVLVVVCRCFERCVSVRTAAN